MKRLLALLVLAAALAGCGGEERAEDNGAARLWVTRDRGARVLYDERVPAGQSVLQALDRVADVETRYGGRFVQSVDGIEGSLERGDDWFFYVNGYLADRGAGEYRLRPGDVAWWDYRDWADADERDDRVVVGAFPEPFLHGYDGKRLPVTVYYRDPADRAAAVRVAKLVGGRLTRTLPTSIVRGHVLVLDGYRGGSIAFWAEQEQGAGPGDPAKLVFVGGPERLLRRPFPFPYQYRVG